MLSGLSPVTGADLTLLSSVVKADFVMPWSARMRFVAAGAGGEDADHQVFDGEVLVAHGLCGLFGGGEDAAELGGHVDLAAVAADLGQRGDGAVKLRKHRVAVNAHALEEGGDEAAVLIDEGI